VRDGEDVALSSPPTPENPISLSYVIVSPDSEGKVRQIQFTEIVHALFNCADMDTSEFVQQFMNAYNIPEMKRGVTHGLFEFPCWTYTGDGIEVNVVEPAGIFPLRIIISKVPTAQERSFD
jgi:hypothetical protein